MDSVASIAQAVASAAGPVIPVGASTKSALVACTPDAIRIDMRGLTGIVGYEPSEYLISALAGTTLGQLQAALDEHGQYLPFDPMFVDQDATLGGTLASGLSGSGHMLYGSLRDFVMEVELVDGLGKLVRGGGKVVKNAAGFDLPKLLVGSYGRLGVLTEITLKVFPRPQAFATLIVKLPTIADCIQSAQRLLSQPLPLTACDITACDTAACDTASSPTREFQLSARFAAPRDSLSNVLQRGAATMNSTPQTLLDPEREQQYWLASARNLEHTDISRSPFLVRIATTLEKHHELFAELKAWPDSQPRSTGGGSCTWLSLATVAQVEKLDRWLLSHGLTGIVIRGAVDGLQALGQKNWLVTAQRIQSAIDPKQKFVKFQSIA